MKVMPVPKKTNDLFTELNSIIGDQQEELQPITMQLQFTPPYAKGLPQENSQMMWSIFSDANAEGYSLHVPPQGLHTSWIYLYKGKGFIRQTWRRRLSDDITDIGFRFSNDMQYRIQIPLGAREKYVLWEQNDPFCHDEHLIGAYRTYKDAQARVLEYCRRLLGTDSAYATIIATAEAEEVGADNEL